MASENTENNAEFLTSKDVRYSSENFTFATSEQEGPMASLEIHRGMEENTIQKQPKNKMLLILNMSKIKGNSGLINCPKK